MAGTADRVTGDVEVTMPLRSRLYLTGIAPALRVRAALSDRTALVDTAANLPGPAANTIGVRVQLR